MNRWWIQKGPRKKILDRCELLLLISEKQAQNKVLAWTAGVGVYLSKKQVYHRFKIVKLIAITIKMIRAPVLVKTGLQFQ